MERGALTVLGVLGVLFVFVLMLVAGWAVDDDPRSFEQRFEEDYAFPFLESGVNIFRYWGTPSSESIVEAFRDEGLPVGSSYPLEEDGGWETSPVPKTYEEGTRFLIPSLGYDAGGRVFVFENEEDLEVVASYYRNIENMPIFGEGLHSHLYSDGLVLLQINGDLPEWEAGRYGEVLEREV